MKTFKSDKEAINYLLDNHNHIEKCEFIYFNMSLNFHEIHNKENSILYHLIDHYDKYHSYESIYSFKEIKEMFKQNNSKEIMFMYEGIYGVKRLYVYGIDEFESHCTILLTDER